MSRGEPFLYLEIFYQNREYLTLYCENILIPTKNI